MNVPDRVVFGLTARQLLLLLIGGSLGHNCWLHLGALEAVGLPGQIVRVALSLLPAVLLAALAMISIADRPLELWLLILVRYWQRPKMYVWSSLGEERQRRQTHHLAVHAAEPLWSYL